MIAVEVTVYCDAGHERATVGRWDAYPWKEEAYEGEPMLWQSTDLPHDVRYHEEIEDGVTTTTLMRCPSPGCRINAAVKRDRLFSVMQAASRLGKKELPLIYFAR